MKKYSYILVMLAMLSPFATSQADDDLLDDNWWQSATLEAVEQKIAQGADVNAKGQDGKTAFDLMRVERYIIN